MNVFIWAHNRVLFIFKSKSWLSLITTISSPLSSLFLKATRYRLNVSLFVFIYHPLLFNSLIDVWVDGDSGLRSKTTVRLLFLRVVIELTLRPDR